jgi:lysophospholipase L1-like esterase
VTAGGDASDEAHGYVGLFGRLLQERFGGASVRVVNAGIGGSNTRGRWPAFQAEVLDHHPDLVTLEFVNDMGFPDGELEERYAKILQSVREAGAALVLITPHFTRPDWMGLPNGRGTDGRHAVAFLRRFAREHGVPLADAARRWQALEGLGIPYETLLKNGINHPDDRGHRIFAEELMRLFTRG